MGKLEGENVQTNIDSQPKKLSSPKKRCSKNAELILKITANDWNPFERADPKLLEKIHKQKNTVEYEEALL